MSDPDLPMRSPESQKECFGLDEVFDGNHNGQVPFPQWTALERSQSSPQLTFRNTQMKAQKRSQSSKHLSPNSVRKMVRFSTLANVREIAKQDLADCWLTHDEYIRIEEGRRKCLYTVKKALLGRAPPPNPAEYSVRGLEQHLSSKQVLERKMKNMHYRRLLLEEQFMQKQYGVSDPQALQSLSELFSQASVRKAQGRAEQALSTDSADHNARAVERRNPLYSV